jgi:hypothetical protein
MKPAKSNREHRQSRRSPITVRVKCLPPGVPTKRNGHVAKGWEMLARDINHDGVGLRWSRRWAEANCPHCLKGVLNQFSEREICLCTPPDKLLKQGQQVTVDGLVYTEKGSVTLKGSIRWVRPHHKGDIYDVGILITSPSRRQHFPALESVGR